MSTLYLMVTVNRFSPEANYYRKLRDKNHFFYYSFYPFRNRVSKVKAIRRVKPYSRFLNQCDTPIS